MSNRPYIRLQSGGILMPWSQVAIHLKKFQKEAAETEKEENE
jgi:hypothetical protein